MKQHTDDAPIVVGVDPSDSARAAASWAADLAAAWGAPLELVHGSAAAPGAGPRWLGELAVAAERAGAERCTVELTHRAPITELTARAAGARMLVLGSYGRGARAGMLAGSLALALIDSAPCPVAVVRGPAPHVPPPRSGPIVVGVDGWAAGHAALGFGAELAAATGARLRAVHAWTELVTADRGIRFRGDWSAVLAESGTLLDAEVHWIRSRHPDLEVERDLVADTSVRALLKRAESARAIVVGHRRDPIESELVIGSTARALAAFAPCPVVVLGPATALAVPQLGGDGPGLAAE